jgi:uncharacterized membrane protein
LLPSSSNILRPSKSLRKEQTMHPLLVIAVPLVLIIIGMILNSVDLSFDQPPSSPEQDPTKRLAAEREAYRQFFDGKRHQSLRRQKRVGQYGWLLLIVTVGAFIWLYVDTLNKAALSNRVAALQTLGSQEGKQMVLSLTLADGSNVKYLIKLPASDKTQQTVKEAVAKETISSWELEKLGTAVSLGDNPLPLGVALKISN